MSNTVIGERIANLRREKGYTQEELAEKLSVSPQAVSKWENNISCPDITLLPEIARLFDVTVDELLGCEREKTVQLVPKEQRRKLEDLMLRIIVDSNDGDKVRVNLPMPLIKIGLETGMNISSMSDKGSLKDIDFNQILTMAENGLLGKLVEVDDSDGDHVQIVVEEV